ncbi:hypothetical protein MLD38_013691 [Melastoma candidum]|uniref:Uncharacterized protein n=1 Tax=Melastoma candidum TaxID=119954 RepID=A0ACB9REK0_9MYRT|nr:hypothetical protein MLD38_013691 [Melastoma candidum]
MGSSAAGEAIRRLQPKPHVVCVPYPAQGHINPFLKLAKILHHRCGFHVTFVLTEYNQKRLLRSRGPGSLDGLPGFRFVAIPDGLPPSDADSTQDIPSLCESTSKNCLEPLVELIGRLNDDRNEPRVSGVIADGVMTFGLYAAERVGVPGVVFWTPSACGVLGYAQYTPLIDKGLVPLKG